MQMDIDVKVIAGRELQTCVPSKAKKYEFGKWRMEFKGMNRLRSGDSFCMGESLMSRHLMVVGGIGTGKTNTLKLAMRSITNSMKDDDVMIIFDTKGDFRDEFYRPGRDVIISNDDTACGPDGKANFWNLVNELEDDAHLPENITEICNILFAEKMKKTKDSFFPNAARDLTGAILYHAVKQRGKLPGGVNNYFLAQCFRNDQAWLLKMLENYSRYSFCQSYISEKTPNQAEGVISEMRQVMNEILIGNFEKAGDLSIQELVRQKKGRRIFIEYDIGVGSMLTPIYSLLFDLAIKAALCRGRTAGNVYFVADEFKLLPNLGHIDDAVNFGRSLGIKFIIGIQNVDQIYDSYGENRARNIFSGFMNQFAFNVSDHATRTYIKERAGQNRKCTVSTYISETKEIFETANVVEDWDIQSLETGEAIIMLQDMEPFYFKFEEYIR